MKLQSEGMIEKNWWRGLAGTWHALTVYVLGGKGIGKEPLVFPFPLFWGLVLAGDKIGITLGSYACADDGFTCTTLCSGHRGRSGVFILYVASFNIVLLFSTMDHPHFLYVIMEKCANINFNHDHVPMIRQTGINRPQNSARKEGISIHSVVRMNQGQEETRINNNVICRTATMQVIGMPQVPRTQELQTSAGRQEEWIRGSLGYKTPKALDGSSLLETDNANATIMRVGLLFTVQQCARSWWQRRSLPSHTSCPQFVWPRHSRQRPS